MNIDSLSQSNFIKSDDVKQRPMLLTIKNVVQYNVAKEGAPEELKWCLEFVETEKALVLNAVNGQLIAHFMGTKETDDWLNHKIVLFFDPTVMFAGKFTGGVRARAPKNQPAPAPRPAPAPAPTPRAQQPRAVEEPQVYQPAPPDDLDVPF